MSKQSLSLINETTDSSTQNEHQVTVWSEALPQGLSINFEVTATLNYQWNIADFNQNPVRNWGLWEFDVVELFWQIRKDQNDISAPYYEWQIAPNNKAFCLEIYRPRVSYSTPLQCPIKHKVELNTRNWLSSFIIPATLTTPINHIAVGAFAILGPSNNRKYFSLVPNVDGKPNFHQPQNFVPLSHLTK